MADDFVKQFQSGPPVHAPKSLEENLREEAIEWEAQKRADPTLVDKAWTDINDAMTVQHQAEPTHELSRTERDELEKDERQFLEAFQRGLAANLVSIGMRVVAVRKDGQGTGWRVMTKDSDNRPFAITITYDDAIDAGKAHGENMGRSLVALVISKLQAAREAYFRRMH